MPLYEYKCDNCGEVFEVMQKFSDEPLQIHDKCGGTVQRLISPPALQFKGSGWYITDYARGGQRTEKTDSAGKTSSGAAAKSESKPADSTAAAPKTSESKPAADKSS